MTSPRTFKPPINDEQGSDATQSDDEVTVPSVTESPIPVEEETSSPSFPEPDMVVPADDEPGTQADSGLHWFAAPFAGERRLEMGSTLFTHRGRNELRSRTPKVNRPQSQAYSHSVHTHSR